MRGPPENHLTAATRSILWWPPAKILVSTGTNGFPYIHVANYMMCRRIKRTLMMCDAFVHLVMRLISRCMKRHLLYTTGKLAHKKMLESHNIYVLVLNLFSA